MSKLVRLSVNIPDSLMRRLDRYANWFEKPKTEVVKDLLRGLPDVPDKPHDETTTPKK